MKLVAEYLADAILSAWPGMPHPMFLTPSPENVRFGSKTDMCGAKRYVRLAPESDRESRHPQRVMSALPPKADMCSATSDVG